MPIDLDFRTAIRLFPKSHVKNAFASVKPAPKCCDLCNEGNSPVNLAFDLSLIAFYDFNFVSCLSCLEVCPNESLPKSDDRNMFKFAFEI